MSQRRVHILDFDIECRPLAWYGGGWVTKQPTAIAWKFVGDRGKPDVAVIGSSDRMSLVLEEERAMIEAFRAAYNAADMVTGHYIRDFDLPTLNSACMRLGLPLLGPKLTEDTKNDLAKASGISKSMENLSAMFSAKVQKYGMDTAKWADANMLLPAGIEQARKRVTTDVREHIELRSVLIERGLLSPPKDWHPAGGGKGHDYTP